MERLLEVIETVTRPPNGPSGDRRIDDPYVCGKSRAKQHVPVLYFCPACSPQYLILLAITHLVHRGNTCSIGVISVRPRPPAPAATPVQNGHGRPARRRQTARHKRPGGRIATARTIPATVGMALERKNPRESGATPIGFSGGSANGGMRRRLHNLSLRKSLRRTAAKAFVSRWKRAER